MLVFRRFAVLVALATVAVAGCSGGTISVAPVHPGGSPTPARSASGTPTATPKATPTSTPSPGATSSAAVAAAATALTNVQATYATLPHASLSADLSTLAARMVSSGQFKTAVVSTGGISATLPNGSPALVFADRVGDTSNATSAQRVHVPANFRPNAHRAATFSGKPETIAFLVNSSDTSGAFNPNNQAAIAGAVAAGGFTNDQYGVDTGDVELSTMDGLGNGGFVDVLDLSTHGMVAINAAGQSYYVWLSDSNLAGAALAKYAADYAAGNLVYAVTLSDGTVDDAPTFAFTAQFLVNHVSFRSGAILINESCFGQSPDISGQVATALKAGSVGRYYGWTEPVIGALADQSDAFIWDRLIGESSQTLAGFVTQRNPPQRPFPLDDIYAIMQTETRSGPFNTSSMTYAQSPATAPYVAAQFQVSDFGGEKLATPPVEYGLPSISYAAVTEDPASPTLTIYGHFPPQTGTAAVIDPTQTSVTAVTPTTWTTDHVVIPIPVSGVGSKGKVVVASNYGVQSNAVPLTQWSGTLTGTENATWDTMNGNSGSGSGTIATSFNIDFRADVHPTVPSIDASPVPQNLTFTGVEGDSTAQVTAISGGFTTGDGKHMATYGLGNPSALAVGKPPFANSFNVIGIAGQPSTCNNGIAGPQTGATNVFCPLIGYSAAGAGNCSDDAGTLCTAALWDATGTEGANGGGANDGQLVFTMNPSTYAITVTTSSPNVGANLFEANTTATGGVSGTIGDPVSPPDGKSPSARTRPAARRSSRS